MPLLKWLDRIDKILFVLIQHDADHSILDNVMPVLRNPVTWIPLYIFMLYYALRKVRGQGQAWTFILLSVLTVAITDSVTAQLLKPLFGRLRPCYDPELSSVIRGLVDCGGLYSMPSNHAANHFGWRHLVFPIRRMSGKKWSWLWLWAASICYAQIYVGKHYPFDIMAGSLVGLITGLGMSRLFAYRAGRQGDRRTAVTLLFKKPPEKRVEL